MLTPELASDQLGPLASQADGAEAAAAERKLAHAASSSSDELRAGSANHIQSYISTHYNVRAMQQGVRPCRILRGRGAHVCQPEHVCWSGFASQAAVDTACCRQTVADACSQVGDDVVLRLEFIRDRQMKGALIGVWVVESLAFIALIADISLKLSKVRAMWQTSGTSAVHSHGCL